MCSAMEMKNHCSQNESHKQRHDDFVYKQFDVDKCFNEKKVRTGNEIMSAKGRKETEMELIFLFIKVN